MAMIDAFKADAFSMASLTTAMNRLPHKPKLLQTLGVFQEVPIRTTIAQVEERLGKLSLLNSAARGSTENARSAPRRRALPFNVPHYPQFQTIRADDIQNIRQFGSETELQSMATYVNDQLQGMKDNHDASQEWSRLGALKGQILDGDGSTTIYNLYAEFGILQPTSDWTSASQNPTEVCADVIRTIADAVGDDAFGQIYALCGNTYFDTLRNNSVVTGAYDRWRQGEYLRMSQLGPEWYSIAANGFEFFNIYFINYRGTVGTTTFLADDEAYFFPTNVPGMFQEIVAPADFMETVNTRGQRYYAKQQMVDFNKGVELHTQHNILAMNSTPGGVVKSTLV